MIDFTVIQDRLTLPVGEKLVGLVSHREFLYGITDHGTLIRIALEY